MAAPTAKQQRFCEEYLIDLNATRAYKAVYGIKSDNIAAVNASKLLRNPKVKEFIAERQKDLSNKLQITQEMVLEGYRKLAFYDVRKFYDKKGKLIDVTKLDDETAFALAGFEIAEDNTKKIKISDRKGALDSISRVLGFNAPEKVDHTTKGKSINTSKLPTDLKKQILAQLRNDK